MYIYIEREREKRGELSNFREGNAMKSARYPEVTYPTGCGRSGTYVTNIQSVHVAYQGLSTTTTKPTSRVSSHGLPSAQPLSIRVRETRIPCWHARRSPLPLTLTIASSNYPSTNDLQTSLGYPKRWNNVH